MDGIYLSTYFERSPFNSVAGQKIKIFLKGHLTIYILNSQRLNNFLLSQGQVANILQCFFSQRIGTE